MRILLLISFALMAFCWGCGTANAPLSVVPSLDLHRYLGTWYEVARLPNSFESGLTCVTANYALKPNGDIEVTNAGHKEDSKATVKTAKGTAWVPDAREPTKLKVRFFWPFSGNYWIIALDPEYRFAMIGEPSREYLWILSRTKTLPESTYEALLTQAQNQGFDTSKVVRTAQDCSD